jgi:WD40 repeat protein
MKKLIPFVLFIFGLQGAFAQKQLASHQLILPGHTNDVNALAVSFKFNLLASAGWDNTINIYNCNDTTFKLIKSINDAHRAPINALKFNKQGNLLASASNDFVVNVFDSTFKKTKMLVANDGHVSNINSIMFDNSGKVVFSGDDDGKIIIWSLETQKKLRELNTGSAVNAMVMSNDPRTVFVAGREPIIKVINVANGQVQRSFVGHSDMINAIEISPNQQYLLSGSNDKSARIWEVKTGKELKKLPVDCWKVTAVAFSFDSKYCATGCNDGSIKIWEVETGRLIENIVSQNYNTRDLVFLKKYSQIAAAPMLKGSVDFGVRIYSTDLIDPITMGLNDASKMRINKFQNAIDSVMKIRTLTKQDSLKFQIKAFKSSVKNTNVNNSKIDTVKIYKTPSLKK